MVDPSDPDFQNTPVSGRRPSFAYTPLETASFPFATIVTPFYNTGAVFRETAASVLNQSLQQWEWLIINDGSTHPESLALLDEYREVDPRIRVIDHSENRGLSAARNSGFRAARARYVVQLDSDDLLEPTAAEKWCWYLESHPDRAFVKGYTVQFGASPCLWTRGFHDGRQFLEQNLVNPTSAVRKTVHQAVRGYDEADRGGLMDWDFWLRCAAAGHWGGTVPEYLDWYRRRATHSHDWPDFDEGPRQQAYQRRLRRKYPQLWHHGFPRSSAQDASTGPIPDDLPCQNRLRRDKRRLLLLVAWMCLGGADRFNLELLEELTRRGWEVTIVTTLGGNHSWLPRYARYTPDLFCLHHFLAPRDYPRFLRYLIRSRQVDVVLNSHSELGYELLPYLHAHTPEVTCVDYCHIEEEAWQAGGYPQMSVRFQPFLDMQIVSSRHLAQWMADRGADPEPIRVCYTNIDTHGWHPDPAEAVTTRRELGVDDGVGLILFAGRLDVQKQPRVLAAALRGLRQAEVPFVALIAGEGPERPWLESFVRQGHLESQVRILGEVSTERLQQLMRASDSFFLPSRWEGIALSVFEAMSSGVPVVASDVGGQRELVTAECGVLVASNGAGDVAERYTRVLAELLADAPRRQAMGMAARRRVAENFDRAQMGQAMIALLDEADRRRASRRRPQVTSAVAARCAAESVERLRLAQWSAQVGAERNPVGLRNQVYRTIAWLATPAYRLAGQRGWNWFFVLGERVKRSLFLQK